MVDKALRRKWGRTRRFAGGVSFSSVMGEVNPCQWKGGFRVVGLVCLAAALASCSLGVFWAAGSPPKAPSQLGPCTLLGRW